MTTENLNTSANTPRRCGLQRLRVRWAAAGRGFQRGLIKESIREWGKFARQRGLPAVIDEGNIWWPPRNSRFEDSAAGRLTEELAANTAIEQGHWGIMLSTYAGPHDHLWKENPGWIDKPNRRILDSARIQPSTNAVEDLTAF